MRHEQPPGPLLPAIYSVLGHVCLGLAVVLASGGSTDVEVGTGGHVMEVELLPVQSASMAVDGAGGLYSSSQPAPAQPKESANGSEHAPGQAEQPLVENETEASVPIETAAQARAEGTPVLSERDGVFDIESTRMYLAAVDAAVMSRVAILMAGQGNSCQLQISHLEAHVTDVRIEGCQLSPEQRQNLDNALRLTPLPFEGFVGPATRNPRIEIQMCGGLVCERSLGSP